MDQVRGNAGEDHDGLGPQAEEEWARLRNQLELASGFWLGFVFAPSPAPVGALQQRAEQLLRLQVRPTLSIDPANPADLTEVLPRLFADDARATGCVWVNAVHVDSPDRRWTAAWEQLLLRLNERRDSLRRHLAGGLVLVAHPIVKPLARDAAPDLWSVRSLVIELRPVVRTEAEGGRRSFSADRESAVSSRRGIRLAGATRGSPVRLLLDEVDAALSDGRSGEAAGKARRVIELLESGTAPDEDLATALAWLSRAEEAAGDYPAAVEHARRALRARGGVDDALGLELLKRAGSLAGLLGDLEASIDAYEQMVAAARRSMGDAPAHEALAVLSDGLGWLGDARSRAGDLLGATAAFEEALAVDRRRVATGTGDIGALRDLSVSLRELGVARLGAGDLATSAALFDEALVLARRILDAHGPTPEALSDVSASLDKLGGVSMRAGDHAAATAAYEESLALDRRALDAYGPSPEALRDLSVSLERLGDARLAAGDPAGATAHYQESLELRRRILDAHGPSGEALRNLSVILRKRADDRLSAADVPSGPAAYEESLALARRILDTYGPKPEAVRDVTLALAGAGRAHLRSRDVKSAGAAYEEALELNRRRVADRSIGDPEALADLAGSLEGVVTTRRRLGRPDDASAAEDELAEVRRRIEAGR